MICTFSGGGTLYDYTMMDAMVALTASYSAAGKSIEFTHLKSGSVKMLKKASHWTKTVVYQEQAVLEHTAHGDATAEGAGDYSRSANIKRRITGLNAPSWSDTPGPGVYEPVSTESGTRADNGVNGANGVHRA